MNMGRNSTNAEPRTHALEDDTLRRVGERDISGLNKTEDGKPKPPPNVRMDIYLPQEGGRGMFPATDWELHAGRVPERIDRINNSRNRGLIGKNINGVSRDDHVIRVGHVPMSHPNRPIRGNPSIATSDATYVPSVQIGQPLP